LPDVAALVKRLCPDVDVATAHGQMDPKSLERTLVDFIDRKYEVLVCTNIIETGLDIPNANTIIINNANQFGLSDLHQLRGRVGRSNKKAFCYLFSPPISTLTPEARKRLRTLEEFSDLGSGFNIAMKDLDIRGAGNLLGGEQSGFITDIGYETYQKILEEAITELKENEYRDLFEEDVSKRKEHVRDVQIDTDVEMHIPDNYVSNIQERLNLYTKLNKVNSEEELEQFEKMLKDRFGDVPKQVFELFDAIRLRQTCKELGFERVLLKSGKLRLYFISNPQSTYFDTKTFQDLMAYVTVGGAKHGLSLKQTPKYFMLIKSGVHTLKATKAVLDLLDKEVLEKGVVGA
jgi:transcription-repair coupling factor (superfamily II helicase)